jgi:hypothetical protein
MQTNIHKEKGSQNPLSIYENLQFPKFTTKNVHASHINQSRRMSSKERRPQTNALEKKSKNGSSFRSFTIVGVMSKTLIKHFHSSIYHILLVHGHATLSSILLWRRINR